jgi:hypothetical protein
MPHITCASAILLATTISTGFTAVLPRASQGPSPYDGGQVPFKFPLPNGFPNVVAPSSTLSAIEEQAHGTLPNTPLPASLAVRRPAYLVFTFY